MKTLSMEHDPPFEEEYYKLLLKNYPATAAKDEQDFVAGECELPLIDMKSLAFGHLERETCMKEIGEAASEWGFFQVINHGISLEVLERIQNEQKNVFYEPFHKKSQHRFLNLSPNSYCWGNPNAISLRQLFWSEAFHISASDISSMHDYKGLRSSIEAFAETAAALAQDLAEILAQNLGIECGSYFNENCRPKDSYVRMNRYPICPFYSEVYGLMPHTDSDFLTILHQDTIGGLQFNKHGKWINIRPNPQALIINIGDLFQVFSNNVYKSTEHRVVVPQKVERFSVAYLYCPSYNAIIESCTKPAVYRKFSFREYKQKIQKDIEATGGKVGLSPFLL